MRLRNLCAFFSTLGCVGLSLANDIPFPDALDRAAIEVDALSSILEHALLIGNGDINALVWTENGRPTLMLTKNDVWDARLDSKLDPPIPTLDLIKKYGKAPAGGGSAALLPTGWTHRGADSYHAHPYPCPRACARLAIGGTAASPYWHSIRAQGTHNGWTARATGAVMSIEGNAGASNGYALDGLNVSTDAASRLRVKIAGSPNARYYIDLMDGHDDTIVFKTGWMESPTEQEDRTWELPPNRKIGRVILYTWTEDGKRAENHFQTVRLETGLGGTPVDLSAKAIETSPSTGRIDVRRAVATVSGPIDAEVRALADRNVFLIRSAVDSALLPVTSADVPHSALGSDGDVQWLTQVMPGDEDWAGMSYAVALAARGGLTAVSIVTSREAKNPRTAAVKLARETLASEMRALIVGHEAEWATFWRRSGIRLGDTFLTDTWYRNLYFLRSVTRPGAMPPGLFASLVSSAPAWHGDYHTNYNIQQTFWSAFNTNQPDLAEPYARLMRAYLPRARWLCKQIFGFDGAYFPHVIFAYEPDPETCKSPVGRQYIHHVWGYTMGVPAFTVQPVWWHYAYQPDRAFLENTAYPLVRDVALFQVNFMDACGVDPDGKLVLGPTVSPEHWGWTADFARNRNSTFDIAMFRYVFRAALEGAQTLNRDPDLVVRWQAALQRLPDYPTTDGDKPVVVDVQDAPPITYNIAVPAVPVFPGDVVTWFSTDAEKDLFARTVENTRWNGNNSIYIVGVSRARLSLPGTREWLSNEIKARLRPNQTITLNRLGAGFNNFGHYTEQFGASMAIGELLLQSVGNIIRVFPAWPKDKDASFVNLRAQGGFLVSAEQRDGKPVGLVITSTVGGMLRLLSPWATVSVNGVPLKPNANGIVTIETQPGDKGVFAPGVPRGLFENGPR